MIRKKPAPRLMRGVKRFSDKIMRKINQHVRAKRFSTISSASLEQGFGNRG